MTTSFIEIRQTCPVDTPYIKFFTEQPTIRLVTEFLMKKLDVNHQVNGESMFLRVVRFGVDESGGRSDQALASMLELMVWRATKATLSDEGVLFRVAVLDHWPLSLGVLLRAGATPSEELLRLLRNNDRGDDGRNAVIGLLERALNDK